MAKAPADQFYYADWLRDVELQMACSATRGIWMNALANMWFAEERGELAGTEEKLARLLNATDEDFSKFLEEAKALHFCYISVTCNAVSQKYNADVTLRNRRMYREEKKRISNKLRQQRHRMSRENNAGKTSDVTPPSSSSSSSSKKKTYVDTSIEVQLSTLLFDLIKERKPDFKKPDLQKWAVHIDRMIRLDKRKPDIITNVIEWAQADIDFWQNNILSTEKLRKQFDQLEMKMNQDLDIKIIENTEKAKPLCVKCKKVPAAYEHDKIGWLCRDCWPKGGDK